MAKRNLDEWAIFIRVREEEEGEAAHQAYVGGYGGGVLLRNVGFLAGLAWLAWLSSILTAVVAWQVFAHLPTFFAASGVMGIFFVAACLKTLQWRQWRRELGRRDRR